MASLRSFEDALHEADRFLKDFTPEEECDDFIEDIVAGVKRRFLCLKRLIVFFDLLMTSITAMSQCQPTPGVDEDGLGH
jgi:hypothetical protein